MRSRNAAVVAAALLLAACYGEQGLVRYYKGPPQGLDQVARIKSAPDVNVTHLNGRPLSDTTTDRELLPGHVTLQVNYGGDPPRRLVESDPASVGYPLNISFEANPGHAYMITAIMDPARRGWTPVVTDLLTKQRVYP